jgi:aryl-alcohol dehydrogenase (NADP+)
MLARANRDWLVIATKVGMTPGLANLRRETILTAVDRSLARLQTEHIDLYYAHRDDPTTAVEETLGAFDELVRAGKVTHIGASNYGAPRLAEALAVSDRAGYARFAAIQPHYNLVERGEYEVELRDLCAREGLGCMPYFALAMGFLTGKYRPGSPEVDGPRAARAGAYLDERGIAVLEALDGIGQAHGASVGAVALAWLAAQPTVIAPIASARTPGQLTELLPMADLELGADELARLSSVSAR